MVFIVYPDEILSANCYVEILQTPYSFDYKPRLVLFFFHHFLRPIIKGGIYIYIFFFHHFVQFIIESGL